MQLSSKYFKKIKNNIFSYNFSLMLKFRIFAINCVIIAAILVASQIPDKSMIDPDAFDVFTSPVIRAAPIITVNDENSSPEPLDSIYKLIVAKGDTIMSLMIKQGIKRSEAYNAITTLSKIFDPRKLKPGQAMYLTITSDISNDKITKKFKSLMVKSKRSEDIIVSSSEDGFVAKIIKHNINTNIIHTAGSIETSLYVAALKVNMPQKILGSLINLFSFDVDFQREIRAGDSFIAMYEEMSNDDGEIIDSGNILIGEMTVQGKQHRFYRHKDKKGFIDYYDAKGRSVKKELLRTPIDGARITSSFGNRKHPILGYTKKHSGIDFGAKKGTPIYAAGNGIIEFIGRNGGYGKYIRIKHSGIYKTAYAHMSRFAKNMKRGKYVSQRQIIGYVGSTGRSTGPHLHYEVHKNNVKLNPLSVKLPTGKTLKGRELATFNKSRNKLDKQFAMMPNNIKSNHIKIAQHPIN